MQQSLYTFYSSMQLALLLEIFSVVLLGAGSLGKSWTGGSSGTAVTAGGADVYKRQGHGQRKTHL